MVEPKKSCQIAEICLSKMEAFEKNKGQNYSNPIFFSKPTGLETSKLIFFLSVQSSGAFIVPPLAKWIFGALC